jgi:hypothetical protein
MNILFNDIIQYSNAQAPLKSPALADSADFIGASVITLDKERPISAVGVGNTDGVNFTVSFNDTASTVFNFAYSRNGLYMLPEKIHASVITLSFDGSFIGRFAAGAGIEVRTSIAKEPSLSSTSAPRVTLSGQTLPGAGGYNYWTVSLDSRYKIGPEAMEEIRAGYKYIGMGYPFFIDFMRESYKLPFDRLYAADRNQLKFSFEGGIRRYLYSRRFDFEERF